MKKEPLFSIVIPTYKGEDSLSVALESICKQTYKNIEVIISDDNGKDTDSQKATADIVGKYSRILNIKYLINEHINGSHARNEGLKIASGDYISFLDDDDFYLETYVEDAINNFDDNDVLFFDVIVISEQNVYKKVSSTSIDSVNLLFYKQEIGTGSNICIRRNVVEDGCLFDERYLRHQDIEFVAKLLNKYKYQWIQKVNIVKYYNNTNNYPSIDKAIEMHKLLRDDMKENGIINDKDYKELELFQLHSLFNDYLAKDASKDNIDSAYKLLNEAKDVRTIDRGMYIVNKVSKRVFKLFFNMYAKKKLQEKDDNKEYYLKYREMLIKEANNR